MKATGIFLLLLVWHSSFSQFVDFFDDGEFTSDPPWSGTTANFSVLNQELALTALPEAGISYLSTPSASINDATWEFLVKMAFNPSSSNYVEVYLAANDNQLESTISGYLVRIGWSTDNVVLIRQDGSEKTVLINGSEKRLDQASVEVRVKITRTESGEWHLFTKLVDEMDWFEEGSATDLTYNSSSYFGIKCNYTKTRADKFFFDDIQVSGNAYIDNSPPEIDTLYTVSDNNLKIVLSELIDSTDLQPKQFELNNNQFPDSINYSNGVLVLSYLKVFELENKINVAGIQDLAGNMLSDEVIEFVNYTTLPLNYGDIVINEIMADPVPPEDLPEAEYVEIINASTKAIYMTNWSLSDLKTESVLPDISLLPDSIVVLYSSQAAFLKLDNAIPLDTWPSLNNAGDQIFIRDNTGEVIDYLVYDLALYGDSDKADGGWSLERVNPYLPCSGQLNWKASKHPEGGSPGLPNSVFEIIEDTNPPELLEAFVLTTDSMTARFTEPLAALPEEVMIGNELAVSVRFLGYNKDILTIKTLPLEYSKPYTLRIKGFNDCQGNSTLESVSTIVLPEPPIPEDIIINEILFNPSEDLHDYLEIYNQSAKYISLNELEITNGTNSKFVESRQIIKPASYVVFAFSKDEILINYPKAKEETIIGQALPSMPNEKGTVIVRDSSGVTMDSVIYYEDWHFSYLNNFEGIALERMSPTRSGLDGSNWLSASSVHNYGTPGYQNSQAYNEFSDGHLSVSPQVIVPDNDGRDDFASIVVRESSNSLLTLSVYNLFGIKVIQLANNKVINGETIITWDGTDEYGAILPLGHYLIVAELIKENGQAITYKEKIVVGTGF